MRLIARKYGTMLITRQLAADSAWFASASSPGPSQRGKRGLGMRLIDRQRSLAESPCTLPLRLF